jgi:hypothetical protein
MKITEIIAEVFNPETSFPIEWDDRHGPAEMHGRAYDRQGGFIDIKFIALRNGVVEVEFSRNDSYDMTGAGDANRVLATILEAFREYLRGYRPKIFVFSAKGGSRSRVYQSMIQRFAAGAGYKQFISGGLYGFGEVNYASYSNKNSSDSTSVSTYTFSQTSTFSANVLKIGPFTS